jgi:hypothetical protein
MTTFVVVLLAGAAVTSACVAVFFQLGSGAGGLVVYAKMSSISLSERFGKSCISVLLNFEKSHWRICRQKL